MKITEIGYRELVSGPGYNHVAREVRATVEDGETAEQAMARAQRWVRDRMAEERLMSSSVHDLARQKVQLEYDIRKLLRERERRVAAVSVISRWSVFRQDVRHLWARLRRKEYSDPDLDDVPF